MSPTVGAVVLCKDEVATIGRCLRSLQAQTPSPARIVVVDNGSTDGSLEIARRFADAVLEVPTGRLGGLRNRGADYLDDADFLAFVDADCEVRPGWVAAALERLDSADLVGSRTLAPPGARWVARRWAALEAAQQGRGATKVWSQHLVIRRSTFQLVGGFDEDLPTGEDADLSARVEAAGGRVYLEPTMVAVHHGFPPTIGAFLRRERWHTRAPGWYSRMRRKSRLLVLWAAMWSVAGAASMVRAATRGHRGPLAAWAASTVGVVPVIGVVGGGTGRTAVPDGLLLGLWALVRVMRLPRELEGEYAARRRSAHGNDEKEKPR